MAPSVLRSDTGSSSPVSWAGPSPVSKLLWRLRRRFGGFTGVAILTAMTMLLSAAVSCVGYLIFAPDYLDHVVAVLMPLLIPLPVALPMYALTFHLVDDLAAEVERRRASEETLRVHATYDHLTSLLNRRSVLDVLTASLDDGELLGVLWIDIDHFKQINDRSGHLEGDRILRLVASKMQQLVGTDGHVGRTGGEEFLVVLTKRSRGLAPTAVRLGAGVRGIGDPTCTVSIGGTACRPGDGPDDLLRRADTDLYVAKHAGRDRAVIDSAEFVHAEPGLANASLQDSSPGAASAI